MVTSKAAAAKAAKSVNASAHKEQNLEALVAKATKASEATASAKAEFEKSSSTLQSAKHKSERLAVEVVNLKHTQGLDLTVEETALWSVNRVDLYAQQNGLDKLYELVAGKLKELDDSLKAAKKQAKSLNSAVRNLLADWEVFEPIFKSVGLAKEQISASLLKEATPFLLLPTGDGLKVCRVTHRVKRDANGNPLKVDGKKQFRSALAPITDWDAMTFATIVLTIELAKGIFSAEAEAKHREFLSEAETALKAVATAKAEAKAAKAAQKQAEAEAKASQVAEEAASLEATAEAHKAAAKAAQGKAKRAAKAATTTAKAVEERAAKAASALKKPQLAAKAAVRKRA